MRVGKKLSNVIYSSKRNVPQDVPQGVPQVDTQEMNLDVWIEEQIRKNPDITTQELGKLPGGSGWDESEINEGASIGVGVVDEQLLNEAGTGVDVGAVAVIAVDDGKEVGGL